MELWFGPLDLVRIIKSEWAVIIIDCNRWLISIKNWMQYGGVVIQTCSLIFSLVLCKELSTSVKLSVISLDVAIIMLILKEPEKYNRLYYLS